MICSSCLDKNIKIFVSTTIPEGVDGLTSSFNDQLIIIRSWNIEEKINLEPATDIDYGLARSIDTFIKNFNKNPSSDNTNTSTFMYEESIINIISHILFDFFQ